MGRGRGARAHVHRQIVLTVMLAPPLESRRSSQVDAPDRHTWPLSAFRRARSRCRTTLLPTALLSRDPRAPGRTLGRPRRVHWSRHRPLLRAQSVLDTADPNLDSAARVTRAASPMALVPTSGGRGEAGCWRMAQSLPCAVRRLGAGVDDGCAMGRRRPLTLGPPLPRKGLARLPGIPVSSSSVCGDFSLSCRRIGRAWASGQDACSTLAVPFAKIKCQGRVDADMAERVVRG